MRTCRGVVSAVFGFAVFVVILEGRSVIAAEADETVEYVVRTSSSGSSGTIRSVVEAKNVRLKLATAEERVKALVSKLDAVSEDASRARIEIHSTLMEAWHIVDLLGKDRCGEAVLQVRKKQQEAESKIVELQSKIATKAREDGDREKAAKRYTLELETVKKSLENERSQRMQTEIEINEAKDRLKHALSVTNRSDGYSAVQAHLKQIGTKISERTELLKQISQFLKANLDAEQSLETVFAETKTAISNHESDFSSAIAALRLDPSQVAGLEKRQSDVQRQFKDAVRGMEEAQSTVEKLERQLFAMRGTKTSRGAFTIGGSIVVTIILMLISIVFGALLVIMGRTTSVQDVFKREDSRGMYSPSPGQRGPQLTPTSAGVTPHPKGPLGRKSSVEGERGTGGSPQDFYHSERSPMTYVRSGASPNYRNY